jgi:hypothetical protein
VTGRLGGLVVGPVLALGLAFGLALSSAVGAAPATATAPPRPALRAIVLGTLGAGYIVTAQGPLQAGQLPAGSPGASAGSGALARLGGSTGTYQRTWRDAAGPNQAQDLVVRFSTTARAQAYLDLARRALSGGEVVGTGALAGVPGARRTTYFASATEAGVGQAITLRVGSSVALLIFVSGASGNADPITPAEAGRLAKAQYVSLVAAAGPRAAKPRAAKPPAGGVSLADVGWAVLAVAVLAAAVAAPLALRRVSPPRRTRRPLRGRDSSSG